MRGDSGFYHWHFLHALEKHGDDQNDSPPPANCRRQNRHFCPAGFSGAF
jgi:hypothetical protein